MIIHGPFKRWPDAPLWVNILYFILEWIDYKGTRIISGITECRYELLNRHCNCDGCKQRRGWR